MGNIASRLRAGRGILGAGPALTLLVLLPLAVLAFLGARYVDAKRVADTEALRISQEANARSEATAASDALNAFAEDRLAAIAGRLIEETSGPVRSFYMNSPTIDMVAVYDASGVLLFPERQELLLFAEESILRQDSPRLLAARLQATADDVSWSGSIRKPDERIASCRIFGARTVCLLFGAASLRELAEMALSAGRLVAFDTTTPSDSTRAWALLPVPMSGMAVAIDYSIPSPNNWKLVLAIVGPTVLASVVAALALLFAHRQRVRSAEQRADILSEISHELRTPLANLRLYAELLRVAKDDSAKVDSHAAVVEEEATRLGWILDNALALSAQKRNADSRSQFAASDDIIRASVARIRPLLSDAIDVTLDLHAPERIRFDVRTFEQVLTNLLDNARKHATGARVTVRSWLSGGKVHLRVSDDGRKRPTPHDGLQGFGLGLRACKTLAKEAGGAFDHKLGANGSWFQLELPIHGDTATSPTENQAVPA